MEIGNMENAKCVECGSDLMTNELARRSDGEPISVICVQTVNAQAKYQLLSR